MSVNDFHNNISFFGLKILIRVDCSWLFLYIFRSLRHLCDRWLATYRSVPPEKASVGVNSRE